MPLMTAQEVSVAFKIPLARVYELTRRGLIPALRLGHRQLRYDAEVLREWVKSASSAGGRKDQRCNNENGDEIGESR